MRPGGDVSAIALFSGGLDSILACRMIMAQGIRVQAVRFVTPFFGYELLDREREYILETREKYGIDVRLRDLSDKYLAMLGNPRHGYGKNFNPCVDCKILIASEARKMMEDEGASFLISGEVLGQRPMSQRYDTLRVIERESGCSDILLRPLCARNLEETRPEREGLVDRGRLGNFRGRGRTPQMELAASLGISDYPSPAGGCLLTDPDKSARIRSFYAVNERVRTGDIRLLLVGRQFRLPDGSWLVLGRNGRENPVVTSLGRTGDLHLDVRNWPGPEGVLRGDPDEQALRTAAGIMIRFSKKGEGRSAATVHYREIGGERSGELAVEAVGEEELRGMAGW